MRGAAVSMIALAALLVALAGTAAAGEPTPAAAAAAEGAAPLGPAELERLAEVSAATDRAHDELQKLALVELQQPEVAAKWRARVAALKAAFAGLGRPDNPRALAVARKIAVIEAYVESAIARAHSMTGSLEGAGAGLGALA